jgi:hypothetical protein
MSFLIRNNQMNYFRKMNSFYKIILFSKLFQIIQCKTETSFMIIKLIFQEKPASKKRGKIISL